jgi:hypothetical protein
MYIHVHVNVHMRVHVHMHVHVHVGLCVQLTGRKGTPGMKSTSVKARAQIYTAAICNTTVLFVGWTYRTTSPAYPPNTVAIVTFCSFLSATAATTFRNSREINTLTQMLAVKPHIT